MQDDNAGGGVRGLRAVPSLSLLAAVRAEVHWGLRLARRPRRWQGQLVEK